MFGIGAGELVVILILALIIFGPGKLPEVGKALGKTIREFKKAAQSVEDCSPEDPVGSGMGSRDKAVHDP